MRGENQTGRGAKREDVDIHDKIVQEETKKKIQRKKLPKRPLKKKEIKSDRE
jgi:hypothetical protein